MLTQALACMATESQKENKMSKMDEYQLKSIVSSEITDALNHFDSEYSQDRIRAMDFYMGEPFGNEVGGRSSVVSTEVADTVEAIMPNLMRVFTANDKYVRFNARTSEDVEKADNKLSKAWSPVSHMNSVVSTDEMRDAYESCLPILSEYGTWVGQHAELFKAYENLSKSSQFDSLNAAQQKVITNALRDFKLSGIDLPPEQQKRYGEIQSRLSDLSSQFSNNVLDATHAWQKIITDKSELAGLPESAIAAAKQMAEMKELDGYLFTLDFPSYLPVMTYSDNASLRQEMYTAFTTRASEQGPNAGEFNNTDIMEEIMALRHEVSNLLGFDSYADKSVATKMASSPEQVTEFLTQLAEKSVPQAKQEVAELKAFAKDEHGVSDLNPWDYTYYGEKLKQAKYSISDEQLRPYFPAETVVNGLFKTVERLFGITVQKHPETVDTWHKDVQFFDIYDQESEYRGSFFLDLYAREKKRGGAWMDDCQGRIKFSTGELQSPIAYLTCNFNQPIGDKPALFTHDEVVTLFSADTDDQTTFGAAARGIAGDAVYELDAFLNNRGLISQQTTNATELAQGYEDDLRTLEIRMEALYERYLRQFAAMESIVGESNSMRDSLKSTFDGMMAAYTNS